MKVEERESDLRKFSPLKVFTFIFDFDLWFLLFFVPTIAFQISISRFENSLNFFFFFELHGIRKITGNYKIFKK